MKLRVERDVFADTVAWAARVLPNRPMQQAHSVLLLSAVDDHVTISGLDSTTWVRAQFDCDVITPGQALVSGRLLADIARALPAMPVELELDGVLYVRCGRALFALPTVELPDYPEAPAMPEVGGSLPGVTFSHAVAQVSAAAGRDEALEALTGVLLEVSDDAVTLAATDRYRLAVRELAWTPRVGQTVDGDASHKVLVPARVLADAAKALGSSETVDIAFASAGSAAGGGDGLVGFFGGGRHITTRLIAKSFPEYQKLLPTSSTTMVLIETAALQEAVKRVSLVLERNSPLSLRFSAGQLELRGGAGDRAQATEIMEARVEGPDVAPAFNAQYLLDGLAALDGPVTRIALVDPMRPVVLSAAASMEADMTPAELPTFRYLLMPMRLPA